MSIIEWGDITDEAARQAGGDGALPTGTEQYIQALRDIGEGGNALARAFAAAEDEIGVCAAQYVVAADELKQHLDAFLPQTAAPANYANLDTIAAGNGYGGNDRTTNTSGMVGRGWVLNLIYKDQRRRSTLTSEDLSTPQPGNSFYDRGTMNVYDTFSRTADSDTWYMDMQQLMGPRFFDDNPISSRRFFRVSEAGISFDSNVGWQKQIDTFYSAYRDESGAGFTTFGTPVGGSFDLPETWEYEAGGTSTGLGEAWSSTLRYYAKFETLNYTSLSNPRWDDDTRQALWRQVRRQSPNYGGTYNGLETNRSWTGDKNITARTTLGDISGTKIMATPSKGITSDEIVHANALERRAAEGIFFEPYDHMIDSIEEYTVDSGALITGTETEFLSLVFYYKTIINYYVSSIVTQINYAQNLNADDLQEGDNFQYILYLAANESTTDATVETAMTHRFYDRASLLALRDGYYNVHRGSREWTTPIIFDIHTGDIDTSAVHSEGSGFTGEANKLCIMNSSQNILQTTIQLCRSLQDIMGDRKDPILQYIINFCGVIEEPAQAAGLALTCIENAWANVTGEIEDQEREAREAATDYEGNPYVRLALNTFLLGLDRIDADLVVNLEEMMYQRNPERLFFKEQCFLLSYVVPISQHKKEEIDRTLPWGVSPSEIDYYSETEGRTISELEENLRDDGSITTGRTHTAEQIETYVFNYDSKKLLPYQGYNERFAESKGHGSRISNASLLIDGDPYGFMNKLLQSGYEGPLLDIDHSVLSLLQPFIRLYKVEFGDDRDRLERQTQISFPTHWTTLDSQLFHSSKSRNRGVGLKNFEFTYDGSNPFGAKKSIKATLKIFGNTFDELMELHTDSSNGGTYRYVDLALKTLNTNSESDIRRENEALAKLNFRLKAQVGWSVPDATTLRRLDMTESQLADLRDSLYDSIVTLNLTPTVHDFAFDEMGRVTMTINYLAYAEEVYSQPKFNVFSEAEFAAAREIRLLKMEHYRRSCTSDSLRDIKEAYAIIAQEEVADSIANLISKMLELDRIYYINVTQEEVKDFVSLGPFADSLGEVEILDDDDHHSQLATDVQAALTAYNRYAEAGALDSRERGPISSALATTSPETTVVSFFYLSDLVDTILDNIGFELDTIPEQLIQQKTRNAGEFSNSDIDSVIDEYESYRIAFRKLRFILGPIEFVNPRDEGDSAFVNLGDIPISVRYWFEWLTSTMLDKDRSFYSLTNFMNDFINQMVRKFLNTDGCFSYNVKQNVNLFEAAWTGPQSNARRREIASHTDGARAAALHYGGHVIDPVTQHCLDNNTRRLNVNSLLSPRPGLKDYYEPSANRTIEGYDEVNYMIYFVGRTAPTERMRGIKSSDQALGIYHYQVGRNKGIVKTIDLQKTATPGLQEVRFEQQGYDGLEQLRVTYDASIKCYANPNTYPGTYIYIDPKGWSPSAQAISGDYDLTKYGVGGYYMIIRSNHRFGPGQAESIIEAKWVNSLQSDSDSTYRSTSGAEEEGRTTCNVSRATNARSGD